MKKMGLDHGKDFYTVSEISPLVDYDILLVMVSKSILETSLDVLKSLWNFIQKTK